MQNSVKQLQNIADRLEAEQFSHVDWDILLGEPSNATPARERNAQHNAGMIVLHSLRLRICLEAQDTGTADYSDLISDSLNQVIRHTANEECISTQDALADSITYITLMGCRQRDVLKLLPWSLRRKVRTDTPFSSAFLSLSAAIARYCMLHDLSEEAGSFLQNLLLLSQKNNPRDEHRKLACDILDVLVSLDSRRTADLSEKLRDLYENRTDLHSARFFWTYALSLYETGNTSELLSVLIRSQSLFQKNLGNDSWLTARVQAMRYITELSLGENPEAEAKLCSFLRKQEQGVYQQAAQQLTAIEAMARHTILNSHQNRHSLREDYQDILKFRDLCRSYDFPVSAVWNQSRTAENYLTGYYYDSGDILSAAAHCRAALEASPPQDAITSLPDELILSNLLHLSSQANDLQQISAICDLLEERFQILSDNKYLYYRIAVSLLEAEERLRIRSTMLQTGGDLFRSCLEDIKNPQCSKDVRCQAALLLLSLMSRSLAQGSVPTAEVKSYQETAEYLLAQGIFLSERSKVLLYTVYMQILQTRHTPQEVLWLDRIVSEAEKFFRSAGDAQILLLAQVSVSYYRMGYPEKAVQTAYQVLAGITKIWQQIAGCFNDHRIPQLLCRCQEAFGFVYGILRENQQSDQLYSHVLRYKDLPALIIRERSRVLRSVAIDPSLKKHLTLIQDQLAAAYQDSAAAENTIQGLENDLLRLEAQLSQQFPRDFSYTDVCPDAVTKAMKPGEAILEYYISPCLSYGKIPENSEQEQSVVELFILTKESGTAQGVLHRQTILQGDLILEMAQGFLRALQNPENLDLNREKESLRAQLYHSLVAPAVPYLKNITRLYIAPDGELNCLPFEILHARGCPPLSEQFEICRLNSARDLLYQAASPTGRADHFFILGDPDYDLRRTRYQSDPERSSAAALPFSGLEAEGIARQLRTRACTGAAATKDAMQRALPADVLHLATHGAFDRSLCSDALYSSGLIFSGYNYFLEQGKEAPHCGNGFLSADEISRLDLSGTRLVVLSACQSGMTDTSLGTAQGLLSAFSAAGVHWAVSHIWNANDFSSAVLMNYFYRHLCAGKSIAVALQKAKKDLNQVTVGELAAQGWLNPENLPQEQAQYLAWLARQNSRRRPFQDEIYWGGFVLQRCN